MSNQAICIRCKNRPDDMDTDPTLWECKAPPLVQSPVTGEDVPKYVFCSVINEYGECPNFVPLEAGK